jgi:hypothetical protein
MGSSWVAHTIPSEQLYNKVSYCLAPGPSSYLASRGFSARMRQFTTQMLVPRGSTDTDLNQHRRGLPYSELQIYEPSHSHPSHPVFFTVIYLPRPVSNTPKGTHR